MDYDASLYLKNINRKYRLIDNGDTFLKSNNYNQAKDFYLALINHELFINDYYPFLGLSKSYKGLEEYNNELNTILDFFKSNRFCSDKIINYFKNRLKDLSEKNLYDFTNWNDLINQYNDSGGLNEDLTNMPVISADRIKKININQLSFDYKFFKDFIRFNENSSVDFKIKFKYKLIRKGNELLNNNQYLESIDYFNKLSNHPLFVNDYYPLYNLSITFKILKQTDDELNVLLRFIHSGTYCNSETFNYFKNRFINLDYQKIDEITDEFNKNGKLNENLVNIPVPSSDVIQKNYKLLNSSIDEKTIVESLINEIPKDYIYNINDRNSQESENIKNLEDDNTNINTLTSIDQIDLKERMQMINILNLIKSGKSRSQAAKIANCNVRNIYKWFDNGKKGVDVNTFYFYSQLIKIDEKKHDDKYNSYEYQSSDLDVESKNIEVVDVKSITRIDNEALELLKVFENYIVQNPYNDDIKEFDLSKKDIEIIKNRIVDKIIENKITGNVDFSKIIKKESKDFVNVEFKLTDDDFDKLFDEVDSSKYLKENIYEAKLKTVEDFNSNKINRKSIKSRYAYYLKKSVIEKNQLERLEDIKNNPNVPEFKKFLSKEEQSEIYTKVENVIKSNHGLKGIVLDFTRHLMNSKIKKNRKEAFNKFREISDKDYIMDVANLNDAQANDFIKQMEVLINKHKIKQDDINNEFIKDLALKFLPKRRIEL